MRKLKKILLKDMEETTYNYIKRNPGKHKKDISKDLKISLYDMDFIIRELVKGKRIRRYYQKENDIRYEVI